MSREGRAPRLVEPEEMVAPLLYVVSREADTVNGWRFDANLWGTSLPPAETARRAGRPAGFEMHRSRVNEAGCGHSSGEPGPTETSVQRLIGER